MKDIGIRFERATGLAVLLAVVMGVVGVASASGAAPEFKGVTAEKPVTFTLSGNIGSIETTSGAVAACSGGASGSGTLTGPKSGSLTLTESGCNLPWFCGTQIKTKELELIPVYISKAKQQVGFELRPPTGNVVASLTCAGSAAELRGSIITAVTPINQLANKFSLKFAQSKGSQIPSQYEDEKGTLVNSWVEFGYFTHPSKERWGLEGLVNMSTAKTIEVTG